MSASNALNRKQPKPIREHFVFESGSKKFDPIIAGRSLAKALEYLKNRLDWSGTKIASLLHLPANTFNTWIKNGSVPMRASGLEPDVQALIHLIAIHRSLEAMFSNADHQRKWLSTFHPELNAVPEELIGESMSGLIFVRQYLDYVRGRGA